MKRHEICQVLVGDLSGTECSEILKTVVMPAPLQPNFEHRVMRRRQFHCDNPSRVLLQEQQT